MPSDREQELELRCLRLVARSTELRLTLAQQSQALERPLAWADVARDGARWLRDHPLAWLAPVALMAALRPARVLRWARRLWWGWRAMKQAGRWLRFVRLLQR
ncbi:MAG: hypothetical protein OJF60_001989 [Burkholderiaceae bacterium]|jgi:hypothetical protein|nr:MAG: hypothetical protein OJF60_001989 [Burkholderiaceae bacterium]